MSPLFFDWLQHKITVCHYVFGTLYWKLRAVLGKRGDKKMVALSNRLASWLAAEGKLSSEQEAVLAYGALTALNTVVALTLMVVLGLLTGLTGPLFAAMVFGAGLRVLSGGAHYTAPWRCSTASAFTYLGLAGGAWLLGQLPWTTFALAAVLCAAWCFSLYVTCVYVPTDTKAYRLSPEKKRILRRLTLISLVVIGVVWIRALVAGLPAVWLLATMLGVLWQMFTVTPVGTSIVHAVDSLLAALGFGGENR